MTKQYKIFSKQFDAWSYEGSFSASNKEDPRMWHITEAQMREFAGAFGISGPVLVVCGSLVVEFKSNY